MKELSRLIIAIIDTTEQIVDFKKNDGRLSITEIIRTTFNNAEPLFCGIANANKINEELNSVDDEQLELFLNEITSSIDNPNAASIVKQALEAAIAINKLYFIVKKSKSMKLIKVPV